MYNGTKISSLFQNRRSCSDPLRILISTEISNHSSSPEAETLTPSYCNRKLTLFLPLSSVGILQGAFIYHS